MEMENSEALCPASPLLLPNALLDLSGPIANLSSLPLTGASTSTLSPNSQQPSLLASITTRHPSPPPAGLDVVDRPLSSKVKGKHVRRESQGSEKENASVKKGKAKLDGQGAVKKRKSLGSDVAPLEGGSSSVAPRPVKKRKVQERDGEVGAKVKEHDFEAGESDSQSLKGKGREIGENGMDVDGPGQSDVQASSKPKPRRKPKASPADDANAPESSATSSSAKLRKSASNAGRKRKAPSASSTPSAPEPFDDDLTGMLIEVLATSRASSMAVSVLCKSVLQAHPYLKDDLVPAAAGEEAKGDEDEPSKDVVEAAANPTKGVPYPYIKNRKSDKAWKGVVQRVLLAGTAEGGGSGVFGKVDSSFKVRAHVSFI